MSVAPLALRSVWLTNQIHGSIHTICSRPLTSNVRLDRLYRDLAPVKSALSGNIKIHYMQDGFLNDREHYINERLITSAMASRHICNSPTTDFIILHCKDESWLVSMAEPLGMEAQIRVKNTMTLLQKSE